jgi:hydrogenase/urease accessory protein HupE
VEGLSLKAIPKFEHRKPKQIQSFKSPMFETGFKERVCHFGHFSLFWISNFVLRISCLIVKFGFRVGCFAILLPLSGALAMPARAEAHLVNTGLGPFYDGVSHLFISPEDLLAVLALGLLAGLGGPRYGRFVLFSLTGAWMVGGLAGLAQAREIAPQVAVIIPFFVVGLLVALDRRFPIGLIGSFAIALGLVHGFLNGTAMVAAKLGAIGLIGINASVFVLAAVVAAFVVWLQSAWTRVGVRIAGSWIAAIGLLMVGWAIKGR